MWHLALSTPAASEDRTDEEPNFRLALENWRDAYKQNSHQLKYFRELMTDNKEAGESIRPLLRLSNETNTRFYKTETALTRSLELDPVLTERITNPENDPGDQYDHGAYLGRSNGSCIPVRSAKRETSDESLRPLRRGKEFSRQSSSVSKL